MLAIYVYLIAELPVREPILLESPEEKLLMAISKDYYQSISLWLRNILLKEALSPAAYSITAQYYQPHAELFAAMADLITAVHRSSYHPIMRKVSSPAELWFYWIIEQSRKQSEQSGLTGKPVVVGKRHINDELMKLCSRAENLKFEGDNKTLRRGKTLTGLIFAEALALAVTDTNFEHDYLKPFLRVLRRISKKIKHCKELQHTVLLPEGKLFVTKKNRKLPPRL